MDYEVLLNKAKSDIELVKELQQSWGDTYNIIDEDAALALMGVFFDNVGTSVPRGVELTYNIIKEFVLRVGCNLKVSPDKFSLSELSNTLDGISVTDRIIDSERSDVFINKIVDRYGKHYIR